MATVDKRLAEPCGEIAGAALPRFLQNCLEDAAGPQRTAKQREHERCVGTHPVHLAGKGLAVTLGERVEGCDVGFAVFGQDCMSPVGQYDAGGQVGMGEFEATRLQVFAECAIGRRGQEQHHCRCHDIVVEARRSDLFGAQAAAEPVIALEQQNLFALFAKHGCRYQCVYAAADHDIVMCRHSVVAPRKIASRWLDSDYFITRVSARIGEPVHSSPTENFATWCPSFAF